MDVDGERKEIASFNVTVEIFILAIFCFSGRAYSCLTAVGQVHPQGPSNQSNQQDLG